MFAQILSTTTAVDIIAIWFSFTAHNLLPSQKQAVERKALGVNVLKASL